MEMHGVESRREGKKERKAEVCWDIMGKLHRDF